MTENIKVVVRVRPALGDEAQGGEAHAVQLAEPAAATCQVAALDSPVPDATTLRKRGGTLSIRPASRDQHMGDSAGKAPQTRMYHRTEQVMSEQ